MAALADVAALPAEADDATVIKRSWDEPERFGVFFDLYFTEIHLYVNRRLGPDVADDIAAEAFAAAFRKRRKYDLSRGNARPWLYGFATNLIGRYRRDEMRKFSALARFGAEQGTLRAVGHEDGVAAPHG